MPTTTEATKRIPARELRKGDVFVSAAYGSSRRSRRVSAVTDRLPGPPPARESCYTRAGVWFRKGQGTTWTAIDRDEMVEVER